MRMKNRNQLLGLVLLLILALGTASCSTPATGKAAPSGAEAIGRSIKVYESPT